MAAITARYVSLKYQAVQSRFDSLVNAIKLDVGKVARKMFEKNLISSNNMRAAENEKINEETRASKLLDHVLNKVEQSDTHFDSFVTILEEIPVLENEADELKQAVSNIKDQETNRSTRDYSSSTDHSKKLCNIHEENELELYCSTCEEVVLVCFKCALAMHKGHTLELLSRVFATYQSKDTSPVNATRDLTGVKNLIVELDKQYKQIIAQKAKIEAKINETAQELHEIIDARKKELIDQLGKMTEEKLERITTQREQGTSICQELGKEDLESRLVTILANPNRKESMMKAQEILRKIKGLESNFNLDVIEPADIRLAVSSTFKKQCRTFGKIFCQEVCPEKCFATGEGIVFAVLHKVAKVILHSMNEHGEGCKKPLSLDHIECVFVSEYEQGCTCEKIVYSKKRLQPDRYEISYQPTTRGRHQLHIKVEGEHIQGSPFPVMVIRNIEGPIQTIENVKTPWGIAINTNENKFIVTENKAHCVSIYEHGENIKTFGVLGDLPRQFEYTHGVAYDGRGNILVVDNTNHRIQKFTPNCDFIQAVGKLGSHEPLEFHYPHGIAVHPYSKAVYIADSNNHRIQVLDPELRKVQNVFGSRGSKDGYLQFPYDIAFDSNGVVYITDHENDRIQVFTPQGEYLRQFRQKGKSSTLSRPDGIAISSDDIVHVTECEKHCISLFTTEGQFLKSLGMNVCKPHQPAGFLGVAVDRNGVIYVCDDNNDCVYLL